MQQISADDLREYVYRYQIAAQRTNERQQETNSKNQNAPMAPPSGASGFD